MTRRRTLAAAALAACVAAGARAEDPAPKPPLRLVCPFSEAAKREKTEVADAAWAKAPRGIVGAGADRATCRALHGEDHAVLRVERGAGTPVLAVVPLPKEPAERSKPVAARASEIPFELVLARRCVVLDFEGVEVGAAAPDATSALTGGGPPGVWKVVEGKDAPSGSRVLAQTDADETSYRFPVLAFAEPVAADVRVATRYRDVSGKVDRAGGVVLRYQDATRYYIARANSLENNVRLYRIVEGKRREIAGVDVPVARDAWHSLAVEARGTKFTVFFDGKFLFEAEDDAIPEAGRMGLWTKADSVTWFDDVELAELYPGK